MDMVSDLRERLIGVKLAGTTARTGIGVWAYRFRSNEGAADAAIEVFAAWLREEAGDIAAEHDGDPGNRHRPIVKHLQWLADAIDPQPERTAT